MVNKCSAFNCRSGYTGENTDSDITFHSFPLHNEELLQKWLQRLVVTFFNEMLSVPYLLDLFMYCVESIVYSSF